MKRESPSNFFVGLMYAFLLVIPFYLNIYWFGLLKAIIIYFLEVLLLVYSINFISMLKNKKSKKKWDKVVKIKMYIEEHWYDGIEYYIEFETVCERVIRKNLILPTDLTNKEIKEIVLNKFSFVQKVIVIEEIQDVLLPKSGILIAGGDSIFKWFMKDSYCRNYHLKVIK